MGIFWPGYIQPDHLLRISELAAGNPSAQHSLLWAVLAYPLLCLSPSYALYGVFQIAIFVFFAFRSISIIQELGLIKTKWVLALFYGFFPTFLLYNQLYCSDIVFSYFVMLLVALFARFVFKSSTKVSKRDYLEFFFVLSVAMLLRKNAVIISVGVSLVALIAFRRKGARLMIVCIISALFSVGLSMGLSFLCHASEDPKVESFSVPSFQIASTYYYEGMISSEAAEVFESLKSPEEWAAAYDEGTAEQYSSADNAKTGVEVNEELVEAWIMTGVRNPRLYLTSWVELEYPFWVACADARLMAIDFMFQPGFVESSLNNVGKDGEYDTFFSLVRSEKSKGWETAQKLYSVCVDKHFPVLTDLFILVLFNRALPFYTLVFCLVASIKKRNKAPIVLSVPVFCIWLSLVSFAPVALMRYAMEMYYALPILFLACFCCKNMRVGTSR